MLAADLVMLATTGVFSERLGLTLFACVVEIRGDWPAICEMFCVRNWAHLVFPCQFCKVPKPLMNSIVGYSLDSCPHDEFTEQDYHDEVAAHEKVPCWTQHDFSLEVRSCE